MSKDAALMFYDVYDRHDIPNDPESVERFVDQLPEARMHSILEELADHLPCADDTRASEFDFVANAQLSGMPEPCFSVNCRVEHVGRLTRFAALYADRVLVHDPVRPYLHQNHDHVQHREHIAGSMAVLQQLRPLVVAGHVEFADSRNHFCSQCFRTVKNSPTAARMPDVEAAVDLMSEKVSSQLSMRISVPKLYPGEYEFDVRGPESLIEHGRHFYFSPKPGEELVKRLKHRRSALLNQQQIARSPALRELLGQAVNDILIQDWYSGLHGCNYITDREIDADIIGLLDPEDTARKSRSMLASLAHRLPLVVGASPQSVLDLRRAESESFNLYRNSLELALRAAEGEPDDKVRQVLGDVVMPEVHELNNRIAQNRKMLLRSGASDVAVLAGLLTVGLTLGALPTNIVELVVGIGAISSGASIVDKIQKAVLRPDEEARQSKYYFLWRASKLR